MNVTKAAEIEMHFKKAREAEAQIRMLEDVARHHRGRLAAIAARAFNDLSEPINGITVSTRDIEIGNSSCAASPIGVCVYGDEVIPIPGQLAFKALEEKTGRDWDPAEDKYPECASIDACLFCGAEP